MSNPHFDFTKSSIVVKSLMACPSCPSNMEFIMEIHDLIVDESQINSPTLTIHIYGEYQMGYPSFALRFS